QPAGGAAALAARLFGLREVLGHHRRVLVRGGSWSSMGQHVDARLVPTFRETDLQPTGTAPLLHIAAAAAARANAHHVHGAMADVMIAVAAKILSWELPIAGNEPFLHPAQDLGAPLPAIPGVQRQVQVAREVTQVF